ncbi:hypothetical protein FOL47_007092 [Perkinsus chesapeaki]|uniref:Uncharacterized protein n=1 Tax=Perkinsus chesapeaki TaxID=330153 RepID=A0A7J6LMS0_PERCH|nr:hypothetical protein FOL47_007092 [Perkinsus chesapeaki]
MFPNTKMFSYRTLFVLMLMTVTLSSGVPPHGSFYKNSKDSKYCLEVAWVPLQSDLLIIVDRGEDQVRSAALNFLEGPGADVYRVSGEKIVHKLYEAFLKSCKERVGLKLADGDLSTFAYARSNGTMKTKLLGKQATFRSGQCP